MKKLLIENFTSLTKSQMTDIVGGSCNVSCNSGYFACCSGSGCDCRENGTFALCNYGGAGAGACTTGPEDH